MAGRIFSQLIDVFDLEPTDQALLETAARLQDVGYLINYEQHHKHSYQLILNSRLAGFQPAELELIANVARYHRGANPKRKHANFRRLSSRDQTRVRQLAAILRVAGGLDRSHTQQVRDIAVTNKGGTTEIRVQAAHYPDLDIWARAPPSRAVRTGLRHPFEDRIGPTAPSDDSLSTDHSLKDNGRPHGTAKHDWSPER